jgi:peptide/nickel transport system permease protein
MTARPQGRPGPPPPGALPAGAGRSPPPSPSLAAEVRVARHEQIRELRRSRTVAAGLSLVAFWLVCVVVGPIIATKDPLATDALHALAPPSGAHWFGTDSLGRDTFARVMAGGRPLLVIAPTVAVLATALGTMLGLVCGYRRGIVDDVLSRCFEALLALPVVIFASATVVALGRSPEAIVVAVATPMIAVVARTVRAAVLSERHLEYIDVARARTESAAHIMFREILPNIGPVVVAEFMLRMTQSVVAVATLSFIGLGSQPPTPDWGRQIAEHYSLLGGGGVWAVLFPVLAIVSLVGGLSLILEGAMAVADRSS